MSNTFYFIWNAIYYKDVQGNIIAILDSTGNVVVEYKYDAWDNHKAFDNNGNEITNTTHIGYLNPFRYRSYYYDTETKLYYLQTRYYDPEVGRFINMDSIDYADPETINGLNLYSYCDNNPVMNIDPEGTWSWKGFWRVLAAVALVVATAAVIAVTAGACAVAIAGAVGATAATASTVGTVVATTAVVSGVVTGIGEVANQTMDKGAENINLGSVVASTSGATMDGAMVGASVFTGGGGKIALTVGRVINSAVTQATYGASENYDGDKIRQNIGFSAGTTLFASAFMAMPSNPITKPYTTGLIKGAIEYFKLRFKYPKYFD